MPTLTFRCGATAIVIAALETGLTAPSSVTAVAGVTTTLEPAPLARFTATSVTSIAESVTTTVGSTAGGLTTMEPSASTGVAARAEATPRFVAPVSGITPAFETAALVGILVAPEAAAVPRSTSTGAATTRGVVPALDTAALGRVAATAKATGVTGPVAGVPATESATLPAALVLTTAVSATIGPAGIVAALEGTPVGRTIPCTVTARFAAAAVAAAVPGITSTVESSATAARVLAVASPAGPGIGSAAPEGLPIVVLFRHGAPFLCSEKSVFPTSQSRTCGGARARQVRQSSIQVLKRR